MRCALLAMAAAAAFSALPCDSLKGYLAASWACPCSFTCTPACHLPNQAIAPSDSQDSLVCRGVLCPLLVPGKSWQEGGPLHSQHKANPSTPQAAHSVGSPGIGTQNNKQSISSVPALQWTGNCNMVWAGCCGAACERVSRAAFNTLPIPCCKCRWVLWANCHTYATHINHASKSLGTVLSLHCPAPAPAAMQLATARDTVEVCVAHSTHLLICVAHCCL